MTLRQNPRVKIVLGLYIACFGIGALNHARDFLSYGWRPYKWGSPLLEIFWTSLIFLDSFAIILLLSRYKRSGLLLSTAIMLSDVLANTYALVALRIPAFGLAVPLQATFLGFVLGSLLFVWPQTATAIDRQEQSR